MKQIFAKKWFIFLLVVLFVGFLTACSSPPAPDTGEEPTEPAEPTNGEEPADSELIVGFMYLGTPGDGGWTYAHDQGVQYLKSQLPNVEVITVENVADAGGDPERIMEQLLNRGAKVIFGTTFGYMNPMIELAEQNPEVYFLHCTGYMRADNMTTYDIRESEAVYLTGMIAGLMTETDEIGYVAAQPIPSVTRAINAFSRGVQAVNPDAKIRLVWTSTWYDPATEREAALSLAEAGCDVLAQYQDTPAVQQAAQERGLYSIGYHSDMRQFAPNANLTSFVWNWGPFYVQEVEAYIAGNWEGRDVFLTFEDGSSDIAPINEDLVPADVISQIEDARSKLLSGDIKVFEGEIRDNKGAVQVESGQEATIDQIRGMDFLVENVIGEMP